MYISLKNTIQFSNSKEQQTIKKVLPAKDKLLRTKHPGSFYNMNM